MDDNLEGPPKTRKAEVISLHAKLGNVVILNAPRKVETITPRGVQQNHDITPSSTPEIPKITDELAARRLKRQQDGMKDRRGRNSAEVAIELASTPNLAMKQLSEEDASRHAWEFYELYNEDSENGRRKLRDDYIAARLASPENEDPEDLSSGFTLTPAEADSEIELDFQDHIKHIREITNNRDVEPILRGLLGEVIANLDPETLPCTWKYILSKEYLIVTGQLQPEG